MTLQVDLPRSKAESILKKTMVAAGYSKTMADIGVWSAVWLEDRDWPGITDLLVYLILVNGRQIDDLRPRKHSQFGVTGACPFMLAGAIIKLSDRWFPRGGIAFGAPAAPFLMVASIADWASTKSQSVRFRHLNYSCLMSSEGVEIEGDDLTMVGMIDPDNKDSILIELTDDSPRPGFRRRSTLKLPQARLQGGGALVLS